MLLLNGGEIDENDENQAKAETETEDWETVVHYFSSSALGFAGISPVDSTTTSSTIASTLEAETIMSEVTSTSTSIRCFTLIMLQNCNLRPLGTSHTPQLS